MAKGIGLIGNFRGKVGNMVGYNLKDSNNKQTQGVRVYQPVVKNPKSYGQAEQRAKLGVINATYRALKSIIDRGQEAKAYGNKSRLAWLSQALLAFNGGWIPKGTDIKWPALVPISKGTLPVTFVVTAGELGLKTEATAASETPANTLGALSEALIGRYPSLKVGDQITFVAFLYPNNGIELRVESIVLTESTDKTVLPQWLTVSQLEVTFMGTQDIIAGAVIASREGDGGQHLRTTSVLVAGDNYDEDLLSAAGKEAAIRSYMAGGVNSDWPQEPVED